MAEIYKLAINTFLRIEAGYLRKLTIVRKLSDNC